MLRTALILLNRNEVFSGDVPLPTDGLGEFGFTLPAKALQQGVNRLEIRNVEPGGRVGNRPWFGIDRVEIGAPPP